MDKYQFADNLITQIRDIPLDSVLSNYIRVIDKSGPHKEALCPFHNDKKLGSFKITPQKGLWYCFTCDIGGDAVTFVKESYGLDYIPAVFKIGMDFGLITQSDYEEYFENKRYNIKRVERIQKKYEDMDTKKQLLMQGEIADEKTRNEIFRMLISHTTLSDEHKKHLLEERNLSEFEIEGHMFFTFPTRRILTKLRKEVEEKFGNINVLGTVPGFFKEKADNRYTFLRVNGIGIPIFNINGEIIGIQVRKDEVANGEKSGRYVWFGSSFANGHEKLSNGTSAGSPIDVIIPNDIRGRTVFITEGKFKGLALAKATNSIVLDVAGVSTWKGVVEVLKELNNNAKIDNAYTRGSRYKVRHINIAYDADSSHNPAVFKQQKRMASTLIYQEKLSVYYLYWDVKIAKGIDDLFNAGKGNLVKRYSVSDTNKKYDAMLKKVLEETEYEKISEVPHEVISEFFDKYVDLVPLEKDER